MESERRKFYKNKVKDISNTSKKKRDINSPKSLENIGKRCVSRRKSDVLILGSQSYAEQNKDLSILNIKDDNKIECDKLVLSEKNEAMLVSEKKTFEKGHENQKGNGKNIENEAVDNTELDSRIEDKRIVIISDILIHIEPEEIVEEQRSSSNINLTDTNESFTEYIEHKIIPSEDEPNRSSKIDQTKTTANDILNDINNNDQSNFELEIENREQEEQELKNYEVDINAQIEITNKGEAITHSETITTRTGIEPEETKVDNNLLELEMSEQNLQSTFTDNIMTEDEMDNMIRKTLEEDDICQENNELIKEQGSENVNKKRKKSTRMSINKNYVDFLSDDEDFVWDSTSWKETDDDSESENETDVPRKKKKKVKKVATEEGKVGEAGLKKKKINKKKLRHESRTKGKSYIKKDGTVVSEKKQKTNPCLGKKCGHDCGEISEEKRNGIFNYFWGLSAQRKRDWIVAMTSIQPVKRKRSKNSAYRSNTYNYYINDGEGRRQVCLKFILNTLNVSQKYMYYTISNSSHGIAKEESRGKLIPINKTGEEIKESVRNWIKSLPALPSHYCRKDTTRLYLPLEFKNIKNLYRIYKETKTSEGVDCLSEKLFRNIFLNEFNLGFHVPKKDKCLKCLQFEGKSPDDSPEMQAHLEEKKSSKARLECHRVLVKDNPSILCTSFDLQKVLNTPHGSNIQLYYSRKYAVYNLCFYESVTRSGFCYVWGESEGNRGANEIATILQRYIKDVDSRGTVKSLILYSDSCPGQNKNKIVLAALHNALLQSQNLETIQMNYLLPGHTEMTVDSIHSTIENSVRHTTVWAPSQWVTICQVARKEPKPYNVEGLMHEDFKSFEDLADKYFKGNLVGKISKLRIATFKKSTLNTMKIKYSMRDDAPEEKIHIIAKPKLINQRYTSSLPITKTKYKDLKKLCDNSVIPRIFHAEYLNLKYSDGNDELLDTDVEDGADAE